MRTVNITPTWEGILRLYIEVIENGNKEGKKAAKDELLNMARVADRHNEIAGKYNRLEALLNETDNADKPKEFLVCYILEKEGEDGYNSSSQHLNFAGGSTIENESAADEKYRELLQIDDIHSVQKCLIVADSE